MNAKISLEFVTRRALMSAAVSALVIGLTSMPDVVRAQVVVNCANLPATADRDDSDGDGFTDRQECSALGSPNVITTGGTVPMAFPWCGSNPALPPDRCLDPNRKDLFVFYLPLATGSLLNGSVPTAIANPFATATYYGRQFNALNDLRVTTHMLGIDQVTVLEGVASRVVSPLSPQKGLVILEDLDTTGETLGYCPYGTPNGPNEDVCTVWTRRIHDYITTTCAGLAIKTPENAESNAAEVFKAYAVETILHEIAHALGGLTSKYVSRYGGYHYSGGTIMEQFVTVSTKSNSCKFAISSGWNLTLDPPAVKLK